MSIAYIVHHTCQEILLVAGATDGEDGDDFMGLSRGLRVGQSCKRECADECALANHH